MQKFLLSVIFLGLSVVGFGQSDIVFSQYIETNSGTTPKGFEIMNVSGSDIDLSSTNIEIYKGTNGSSCSSVVTISSGTLAAGEVWVVGTSDLVTYTTSNGNDYSGTTTYGATHNGDDAHTLYLDGVLQDMIGVCGSDPGSQWSGNGVSTKDQNVGLLDGICDGDTDGWTDPSTRFEYVANGSTMTGFGDAPHSCGSVDPEVEFVISEISATEGDATVTVDLSISDTPSENINVGIRDASGTKAILDDGAAFDETITFPSGNGSNQTLTIDLDAAYALADCASETVVLEIYTVSVGTANIGATSMVTLTLDADFCPCSDGVVAFQSFEQDADDTWSTTFSTPACTSGDDIWDYAVAIGGYPHLKAANFGE